MRLELKQICKNFGDKEVLKGINLSTDSGQALGLLGRNGAGKTTTIRIITGIFRQDIGEVLIDGIPVSKTGVKMGYMPEERGLYPKRNILEQMLYLGQLKGMASKAAKKNAYDLLEQLEATEHINKRLDNLSKGNQQKIQLAITVIDDPDIVILDEPFSGLDPVNASLLKKLIEGLSARGKVVLFSSHQMAYVEEFCRHICIMQNGEIVVDGLLSDIKRGYPRDKIWVVPENGQDFENITAPMLTDISQRDEGYICTLKSPGDKDGFMALLVEHNISIERFEVMEPTLEEIFVEKAGA